jgi:hypothetical protein
MENLPTAPTSRVRIRKNGGAAYTGGRHGRVDRLGYGTIEIARAGIDRKSAYDRGMEVSMLRQCARLSLLTLAVMAIGLPLFAVAWVAVALMGY